MKGSEPRTEESAGPTATMTGLHEGEYTIYAFDDISDLEYANPEVMRKYKSQTVQVHAGERVAVQAEVNRRRTP